LVISSDKGLCGGYNSQLEKKVLSFAKENGSVKFKFHFIGKKVREIVKKDLNIGKTFTFERLEPSSAEIRAIAEELGSLYSAGEYAGVYVAYNIFRSAISFNPTVKQLLPMTLDTKKKQKLQKDFPFDFKYEPSVEQILNSAIPEAFINTLYTCILDAAAAEQGSRMSAMENATSNCKDAIRSLTLKMNKLRQAAITTELIEVVSGAESLNG